MTSSDKLANPDVTIQPLLAERWSPYAYSDRDVSEEDLRAIFEAARWAPSSYNEQPWRYIVARRSDGSAHSAMVGCLVEGNQVWAKHAPVLAIGVVMTAFRRNAKPNKAAQHDLGLASGNICVEATARGLFVHQMIGIVPERVREIYKVPEGAEPLTGLAIGYPGDGTGLDEQIVARDRGARTRMPAAEIVFAASWGAPAFPR
ncbi:MAG TPA: nitroreductase family protein [Candidatus Binatia bacterium]|jgi:nitroreductase